VAADVHAVDGGFVLGLDEAAFGVAPGQVAALYADDVVVGAGVVTGVS
jgi:tRNA U34 2-thiouridine synthase MnmA/TrmU